MIERTVSHFRILSKIGEGGMGIVYRAQDIHLRRPVALKILPPDVVHDVERRRRFLQEARAAAAITHPNIATVYEAGETESVVFIAMELVEGSTLRARIQRAPIPLEEALSIGTQVVDGLACAHQAGVVHGDLKPENVIVRDDGQVKILDFGLAKLREQAPPRDAPASQAETLTGQLTRLGLLLGTAAYMSPEQARGEIVDSRSDLFSFGVVRYEMLAGRRPFQGRTTTDILSAIVRDDPVPASDLRPEIPPGLDRVLEKCLTKDRTERYQHAAEVASDQRRLLRTLAAPEAGAPSFSGARRARATGGLGAGCRRSRRRVVVTLVGGMVVAVAVGAWWQASRIPRFEAGDAVIVADIENRTGRAEFDAAIRDALEEMLGHSTLVRVIARRDLEAPPGGGTAAGTSRLDGGDASGLCRNGTCVGYVDGAFASDGTGFRLRVRIARAGVLGATLTGTTHIASAGDILLDLHRLVLDLRRRLGESPAAIAATSEPTTHSLVAYQAYAIGEQMKERGNAVAQYREAVRIAPDFVQAQAALANTLEEMGRCREARDAAEQVRSRLSQLDEVARSWPEIVYLESVYEYDAEAQRLKALEARSPTDPAPLSGLEAIAIGVSEDWDSSLGYAQAIYRLAPDYWTLRDLVISLARTSRATEIAPLVAAFQAGGGTPDQVNSLRIWADATREDLPAMRKRLAAIHAEGEFLRGTSEFIYIDALIGAGRLSEGGEAIASSWRAGLNQSDNVRQISTWLWKAWLDSRASGELPAVPADQMRVVDGCAQFLPAFAAFAVEGGITDRLAAVIGSYEAEARLGSSRWVKEQLDFARGCVAVGRRQTAQAIALLEPLARSSSSVRRHQILAFAYETAGRWSKAAAEYEWVLGAPENKLRADNPAIWVLDEYRLARVYEREGKTGDARRWYERFLAAWRDADAGIPELAEARRHLAALGG